MTAITTDVEALEVFFAHTISPVLIAIGTTIITVSYLWQYSVLLGLILLLGQLIVGIVIPVVGYRKSRALGDDYQKSFVELNQTVMENTASLQDITQYAIETEQLEKLTSAGDQLNVQYKRRLAQESQLRIVSEIVLLTTAVSVLVVGVTVNLSAEAVLTATVLSLSSFGSVLALSGLGSALLTTLASGRRLFALTTERPDVDFKASHKEITEFEKSSIENVSFSYATEQRAVLSDLTFQLKKGRSLGSAVKVEMEKVR